MVAELRSLDMQSEEGKEAAWWGLAALLKHHPDDLMGELYRLGGDGLSISPLVQGLFEQESPLNTESIERALALDRFGARFMESDYEDIPDFYRAAYDYAAAKGYTSKPFEVCLHEVRQYGGKPYPSQRAIAEEHDADRKKVFYGGVTFGSTEPTYIELLGPAEIVRLRTLEHAPVFLLLGSLGSLSARDAVVFAKKIRSDATVHVVDLMEGSIEVLDEARKSGADTGLITQGNALLLPYGAETIDVCMTNVLLRSLLSPNEEFRTVERMEEMVRTIAKESNRVLRPGGSMLLAEYPYGFYDVAADFFHNNEHIQEIDECFEGGGFTRAKKLSNVLSLPVSIEIGKSKISQYGFGNYKDLLVSEDSDDHYGVAFVKARDAE